VEFPVRLDDKVNTQVFCLNPVHKGNHMDRVFYDDPTFNAPCPDCGDFGEWLYRKNNAISKKGHLITFKPDGWSWGTNERKHFGIVRIDCAESFAREWCGGIVNEEARSLAKSCEEELEDYLASTYGLDKGTYTSIKQGLFGLFGKSVEEQIAGDAELQGLKDNLRNAESRVVISERPRKYKFDYENAISDTGLDTWSDPVAYSKVISISRSKWSYIKEEI